MLSKNGSIKAPKESEVPTVIDKHHNELHQQIHTLSRLADWIYHDQRLDCDASAISRTSERLALIEQQHGVDSLFGLSGSWAQKATARMEAVMASLGGDRDVLTPYVSEKLDSSQMSTEQRAFLSAVQFTKAISVDDLEMSEAIFRAAAYATPEDLSAFVLAVLSMSITISDQAYAILDSQ